MKKPTYLNAHRKIDVRRELFSFYKEKKIIGLAGPDINEYIESAIDRKIKEFVIYENDPKVFVQQLRKLKYTCTMKMGDICFHDPTERAFYDLDFCRTIKSFLPYLNNYWGKFVMTFSLRAIKLKITMDLFFSYRNETVISGSIEEKEFITNKGRYIIRTYRDSSPMVCIAKV